ncbi:hypothetical protein COB72_05290 [bacterium]|nr:MAG: hypothetical protein COB72_05290 [bacterium]
MAKPTPWKDEYTLLCQACGYVLEGLDLDTQCPECGKSIEESLAKDRPGTPWQRKASILSMIKTWYLVFRHPKRTIDEMRIDEADGIGFAVITPLLAMGIFSLALLPIPFVSKYISLFGAVVGVGVVSVMYWLLGFTYSAIASGRIRFAAKRRGYRVDREVSWALAGYASTALILIPLAVGTVIVTGFFLGIAIDRDHLDRDHLLIIIYRMLAWNAFLFCLPISLVVFEVFTYIGLRRCRYTNRIRPQETCPNEPRG